MKKLITRDRYDGLDPEIARALKDGKMVRGKDPAGEICWLKDCVGDSRCIVRYEDLMERSLQIENFFPTYESDNIPDESTPVDTLCEVWDWDREGSIKRHLKGIDRDGDFTCWADGTTSKTSSDNKYTLWKNARIIEYPDGTKPLEE